MPHSPFAHNRVTLRNRLCRSGWVRRRLALSAFAGAGVGAAVIAGTVGADRLDDTARAGVLRADVSVNVTREAVSRPVSAGFVGLSIEYPAVTAYAGSDRLAINPVFEQLVRNLAPNQRPVLRIGGDSTDRTWWPVSHLVRPSGVTYSISPRWLAVARALAHGTGARLILGVNLEANQPSIAAAEARALLSGVGARSVLALEIETSRTGTRRSRGIETPADAWYSGDREATTFERSPPSSQHYANACRECRSQARPSAPSGGCRTWEGSSPQSQRFG